jgi:hypothetical protein
LIPRYYRTRPVFMEDIFFEAYKKRVYEELERVGKGDIPAARWDSVIRHYYGLGYSEERTVRTILETMTK